MNPATNRVICSKDAVFFDDMDGCCVRGVDMEEDAYVEDKEDWILPKSETLEDEAEDETEALMY